MSPVRPFRFGIQAYVADSRAAWAAKARQIEDLGYDTLTMPDHFGPYFALGPACMVAAAATTRLKVGSFVLDNDFRHPALLAKEAATIDLLTDGRLLLGLGAGWRRSEYEQIGLTFDPAGVRLSRMEESVRLLKQLFTGQPVTFAGQFYQVTDLTNYPLPLQRPHPPILIGGGGQRVLTIAAREADIVGFNPRMLPIGRLDLASTTRAATAQKVAWVRAAAGERLPLLEFNFQVHHVVETDDRLAGAEQVARESHQPVAHILDSPYILLGSIDSMVEQLEQLRAEFGISYINVRERYMTDLAPVVARLNGR